MSFVRSIAWMVSDPQRVHVALHAMGAFVQNPPQTDGLGVASSLDGGVLLSRKPAVAEDEPLHALVGPLKGRCGVIQMRSSDELRPRQPGTANLGPFRFRHFAGALIGGPQDADEATAARERWLHGLPDYLDRSVYGHSEAEALFLAIVNRLRQSGLIEPGVYQERLIEAIEATLDDDTTGAPRAISIATGLEVVHVTRGIPSALTSFDGLTVADADAVDGQLADSSIGKERLRRFRGTFLLSGAELDLAKAEPREGLVVNDLGSAAAAIVSRGFEVTRLPR